MFSIDITNREPIYQQLEQSIIRFISVGVLLPNEQLPSVRNLAIELQINPNTVQKAYASLEQKGLIYMVPGRGAFVAEKCEYISTLKRMLADKLQAAAKEAKAVGVTLEEQQAMIALVYEEGKNG